MKTLIYEELENKRVKCGICNHFCTIEPGKRGICQVRENRDGELISLVYPKIISRAIDPIEKKPIFHLLPGSTSYSIATEGCNFQCSFCQNSSISQIPMNQNRSIRGADINPEKIVDQAINSDCASISYTYTEPTVYFELALETAKIAHSKGLRNVFVTNGFMSKKVIEIVAPYLDAANVDLKAFNDNFYRKQCKGRLEPIKENLILMKSLGILVEVTTLLIPDLNDEPSEIRAMAQFIANDLGIQTPWHISRFHPCYQMTDRGSTPIATLKMAFDAGKDAGLRYVYTGNAPGLDSENTFCHVCGRVLIQRVVYNIKNHITSDGRCPDCGTKLYGIF
ncbi:MAG: AmmeMemoRadiSam system radical SAM enzyme [Desulfamplus sp.]|nr:AmmeMemoRadiSam system radical SAM enzyme [Desulfamplus sp.]MBF0412904.1 AmmeMemoRadiSam system radical SAM enzyme [Desulfamplus sp.]